MAELEYVVETGYVIEVTGRDQELEGRSRCQDEVWPPLRAKRAAKVEVGR